MQKSIYSSEINVRRTCEMTFSKTSINLSVWRPIGFRLIVVRLAVFLFVVNPISVYFQREFPVLDNIFKFNIPVFIAAFLTVRRCLISLKFSKGELLCLWLVFMGVTLNPLITTSVNFADYSGFYFNFLVSILLYFVMGMVTSKIAEGNYLTNLLIAYYALVGALILYDLTIKSVISTSNIRFGYKSTLQISDMLAIITLISLDHLKGISKIVISIFSLVLLILLSSFTSVSIYILSITVYALTKFLSWKRFKSVRITYRTLFGILLLYSLLLVLVFLLIDNSSLLNQASLRLLDRVRNILIAQDNSLLLRDIQLRVGLDYISEHFLLGKWLYHEPIFGSTGNYIHNILSWWAEYGVFTFAALVLLLLLRFVKTIRSSLNRTKKSGDIGILTLLIYVGLSVIFSRSHQYMFLWFALGMSFGSEKGDNLDTI